MRNNISKMDTHVLEHVERLKARRVADPDKISVSPC